MPADVEQARQWIAAARSVAVLTGAGISAESGIPTFRGAGGMWKYFLAEDLATPQAFTRDPKLSWEWYDWRRQNIAKAQPNTGHLSLVELERRVGNFTLVTQNVDGLHTLAGSQHVVKIHGDIWDLRCTECGHARTDRSTPLPELPPQCDCGALLRPGVVWFGESLPAGAWDQAVDAAQSADVFLVVGTSAVVFPAAGLIDIAHSVGAKVIEVNIDETAYSGVADASLRGSASEILPKLVA